VREREWARARSAVRVFSGEDALLRISGSRRPKPFPSLDRMTRDRRLRRDTRYIYVIYIYICYTRYIYTLYRRLRRDTRYIYVYR